MISWIIDSVPYWVWFVLAAIALAATYPFWSTIWLITPRWLKATLIAIAALLATYLAGRNRGLANEKARQAKANAEATKRRLDTNAEVDRMRPADRDKSLDKWMRD
jgi:hypothetical protein